MAITLILGGARSGKSRRAQRLALQSGKAVVHVATAPEIEGDDEWKKRIQQHQQERPETWLSIEEPLRLAKLLERCQDEKDLILVDCLTLWLSNILYADWDVENEVEGLCVALAQTQVEVILVSNEVGMGLVPDSALGRTFRDAQGRLNQAVAQIADKVEFVVAGLPMCLKGDVD